MRSSVEAEKLKKVEEVAESFMLTQFIVSVTLTVAVRGTFTQLWNIFNTM